MAFVSFLYWFFDTSSLYQSLSGPYACFVTPGGLAAGAQGQLRQGAGVWWWDSSEEAKASSTPHLLLSLGSHPCFPPALQLSLYLLSPDPDLPTWLPSLIPDQLSYYRLAGDTWTASCPLRPCPARILQGYILAGKGLVQSTWLWYSALGVSFMILVGCSSKYFFQTFFTSNNPSCSAVDACSI